VPASTVEGEATHDALAAEPDALQCPPLGQVLDVGDGLDAVRQGAGEQVLGEQPLRGRPEALAAVLGKEQGADLQAAAIRPPVAMVRQATIPASVSSSRATASWPESSPSQPSFSHRN
jgi:hypothetical protein